MPTFEKSKGYKSPMLKKIIATGVSPYTMKGSPMKRNFGELFAGVKDPEQRKKLTNLYKHADEFKDNPDYWKKVKEVLGTTGDVSYKGETY